MKYYVAYGSNLNLEHMSLCCPAAKVVGTSVLEEYELFFRAQNPAENSYLTIEKKIGSSIPVAVWQISEADESVLDDYEDYPELYYKETLFLDVRTDCGGVEKLECFVYIMYEEKPPALPSDEYLAVCLEGYKNFSFDEEKIYDALSRTRADLDKYVMLAVESGGKSPSRGKA